MKKYAENERTAVRYLFGELAGAERDRFEERLFEDENFRVFLDDVENDLIDEYMRGELEFEEKRKFENVYLKSEARRIKVEIARILNENMFKAEENTVVSTAEENTFSRSFKNFFRLPNLALAGGLAAILLLALVAGIRFFNPLSPPPLAGANDSNQPIFTPGANSSSENTPPDKGAGFSNGNEANIESKPKNTETNRRDRTTPPKPKKTRPKSVDKPDAVRQPVRVFAFSLLPPLRSSKKSVLNIPAAAQIVRLQLIDNFGQKYVKYLAELSDINGNTIWKREIAGNTKREQKSMTVNIAAEKLKTGSYELAISGVTKEGHVEEINFYNFVVQTR